MRDIFDEVIPGVLVIIVIFVPLVLTIANIRMLIEVFEKNHKPSRFLQKLNYIDVWSLSIGVVFTSALWIFFDFKDYTEPLIMYFDTFHAPIQEAHMNTIIIIMVSGGISYMLLRFKNIKIPPLGFVICLGFVLITNYLAIVILIQLSKKVFAINYFMIHPIFYLTLLPINYLLCTIRLIKQIAQKIEKHYSEKEYKSNIISKLNSFIVESNRWIWIAFIISIPLLIILIMISQLFGQEPSSIIKAFTETSDWTLSQKSSPPPIEYDGHYLCTVALMGHDRLVKPKRYGIRRGQKIVVNRQLMVANAFEEVIQEKLPFIHKHIRYIYDRYGFPLSKLIKTKIAADIVYVSMKPLELLFLIVLYIVDIKPEDRIETQYLPNISLSEISVVNIS